LPHSLRHLRWHRSCDSNGFVAWVCAQRITRDRAIPRSRRCPGFRPGGPLPGLQPCAPPSSMASFVRFQWLCSLGLRAAHNPGPRNSTITALSRGFDGIVCAIPGPRQRHRRAPNHPASGKTPQYGLSWGWAGTGVMDDPGISAG
jgi:hypothetical protein